MKARVTQIVVEALVPSDTASPTTVTGAGVSQLVVEALIASPGKARVSQLVVEVLMVEDGDQFEPPDPGGGGEPVTTSFGWAG